ncbi:hypothetical protein K0M31_002373 [Melipona bicolor]|uniref:Uncharacterized protein n=1 Tax=Melipona bicolor TaxID=60889 RepID=A0AA40GHL7_9HYME|nr:hypothetical protein K0M31_002373 [Melipona bicolor]
MTQKIIQTCGETAGNRTRPGRPLETDKLQRPRSTSQRTQSRNLILGETWQKLGTYCARIKGLDRNKYHRYESEHNTTAQRHVNFIKTKSQNRRILILAQLNRGA